MWISPLFPKLKKEENKSNFSRGDSPTNFKKDLLDYIGSYKAYQLKDWQQNIADHDMSSAKYVTLKFLNHNIQYVIPEDLILYLT